MVRNRSARVMSFAARVLGALVLVSGAAAPALEPAAPARADHTLEHDPAARLQVVVRSFRVEDDGTSADADWDLYVFVGRYEGDCTPRCTGERRGTVKETLEFEAGSGVVQIGRALPDSGSDNRDPAASPETGIAVDPDEVLGVSILARAAAIDLPDSLVGGPPDDPQPHDLVLREREGWGLGSHSIEFTSGFRATVDFEVRRAPLPDLHPAAIRVEPAPSGRRVCMEVENIGERDAGPFAVALRVDGAVPEYGTASAMGLAAGQKTALCNQVDLPSTGTHELSLTTDPTRAMPEMDEANNHLSQPYRPSLLDDALAPIGPAGVATEPGAGPDQPPVGPLTVAPEARGNTGQPGSGPVLTAPGSSADLLVSEIRVRGEDARGNNDCDPGRNDVTVIVKNQGNGAVAGFAVRVVVDDEDDEAKEKAGVTLDGGKELAVTFDDLRLRKGDHKLVATADARKAVAESDEDNNELTVTVQCKDEG